MFVNSFRGFSERRSVNPETGTSLFLAGQTHSVRTFLSRPAPLSSSDLGFHATRRALGLPRMAAERRGCRRGDRSPMRACRGPAKQSAGEGHQLGRPVRMVKRLCLFGLKAVILFAWIISAGKTGSTIGAGQEAMRFTWLRNCGLENFIHQKVPLNGPPA